MTTHAQNQPSAEAAISEVLDAERDALAGIASCEAEAKQIHQQARQAVRALVRNTQSRISDLHSRCEARTRDLVAEMERAAAEGATESHPDAIAGDRLLDAVGRVAAQLTARDEADVD